MTELGIFYVCNSFVTREEMKRLAFECASGLKYGRTSPDFDFHIIGRPDSPCSSKQNAQILAQDRLLKAKNRLNSVFAVPFKAANPGAVDIGAARIEALKQGIICGAPDDRSELLRLTGSKMGKKNVYYLIVGRITF